MSDRPIDRLHRAIDAMSAPIAKAHEGKLACRRGCSGCCVDVITVYAVEAEAIERAYGELLSNAEPHPVGACAFLDAEGACRVYDARPYVCRTQGLPLRWIEEGIEEGIEEAHEARDVCTLNLVGGDIAELPASACWTIGPVENKLIELQPDGRRVALRSLFRKRG
jgi:Fe-S-cluster containining protein